MKKYTIPQIKVICFNATDVIRTSIELGENELPIVPVNPTSPAFSDN